MADADAPIAAPPRRRDLTQGPIGRTLLAFALPTLGSSILQSLNGSINSIWVGRLLGEEALAATFNANMTIFVLSAFTFGFSMATSILIGQAFGRRDVDAARRTFGSSLGFFAILGLAIGFGAWFGSAAVLRLLSTPAEALPLADAYLATVALGLPPAILLGMMMMALRGAGDSLSPLWAMLLAVVLDAGLNPFLIAGIGPFPQLGISGSALANVIANWIALLALLGWIYARDLPLRLRGAELRYLRPSAAALKIIVLKGLPMGLQMIVISASSLALVGLVNAEGVVTAAAFGVTMT